jgi:hypothetical protein
LRTARPSRAPWRTAGRRGARPSPRPQRPPCALAAAPRRPGPQLSQWRWTRTHR